MERAESLARILDVNETFARDQRGANHWLPIVLLHADRPRFEAAYGEADAESVIRFYLLDQDNPTSIISSVASARENARVLRHLISTEMWAQLNVFHHRLLEVPVDAPMGPATLPACVRGSRKDVRRILASWKARSIATRPGTSIRSGKMIERADQTTRLLDINYPHAAFER